MDIKEELKKGPIILDNILPLNLSEKLKKDIYNTAYFSLGELYEGTSSVSNDFLIKNGVKNVYEQFQCSENFVYVPNNHFQLSNYHLYILPLTVACLNLGIHFSLEDLYRCKINLQTRAPESSRGKYNYPHVDVDVPDDVMEEYITALYYINDSDGDTYIFNEEEVGFHDIDKFDSLTIKKQISPKQGRIVLFNIKDLHAGANPIKNDFRMVINYNFKINKLI